MRLLVILVLVLWPAQVNRLELVRQQAQEFVAQHNTNKMIWMMREGGME